MTHVSLPLDTPLWDRLFGVFPLVLVGTREADGGHDLAPKHMAMPMSWDGWFGFVCAPHHRTWSNAVSTGAFTVSYPRPEQVLLASLAAAPRQGDADGPRLELSVLPVRPAEVVDGVLVEGAGLQLECTVHRTVEDLGPNGLIIGRVVAAHADPALLRRDEVDDAELIFEHPVLAYLHPGRFAAVAETQGFPFPRGFRK